MNFSNHATDRLTTRLNTLTSYNEVLSVVNSHAHQYKVGETWVAVKNIPFTVLPDGVNGDTIYAIVRRANDSDRGVVATVELRNHNQKVKGQYKF